MFRFVKEANDAGVEYERHTGPHTGGDKFKREQEALQGTRYERHTGPHHTRGDKFKREQEELQGTRYRDVKTQSVTVIRFFNS